MSSKKKTKAKLKSNTISEDKIDKVIDVKINEITLNVDKKTISMSDFLAKINNRIK
jgi:hypothetical protein